MFKIVEARDAVEVIKNGDCIGINAFLALCNPEALHQALFERVKETGQPRDLRLFCAAGFGAWDESRFADPYIAAGAVREIVAGHFASMPAAVRLTRENRIEAYNIPLGVLSHAIRAAAAGKDGLLSEIGLNIFVDPRVGSPGMNAASTQKLVENAVVAGREFLYYKTPKFDVAFIRGTTLDPNGNVSFEKEYVTVDALAMAQATKANGGTVIVQVNRVSHSFQRPRSIVVPGILVDLVVVAEGTADCGSYYPAMSGDIHVPPSHMDYYMGQIPASRKKTPASDGAPDIIGARAARELRPGHVVNIGIGIPEMVGKWASRLGVLQDIVTTVESGVIGGLPAPGVSFGASIGADMICDMASQFDFYDGGGLDICFMGGLEVDAQGNVNSHESSAGLMGIGGFANITAATKTVVFCLTFTAKGLIARKEGDRVVIEQEGSIAKFKKDIAAISFSAKNALRRGQRVLYVTERCVFELTTEGIRLKEAYEGINRDSQISALLDFAVK